MLLAPSRCLPLARPWRRPPPPPPGPAASIEPPPPAVLTRRAGAAVRHQIRCLPAPPSAPDPPPPSPPPCRRPGPTAPCLCRPPVLSSRRPHLLHGASTRLPPSRRARRPYPSAALHRLHLRRPPSPWPPLSPAAPLVSPSSGAAPTPAPPSVAGLSKPAALLRLPLPRLPRPGAVHHRICADQVFLVPGRRSSSSVSLQEVLGSFSTQSFHFSSTDLPCHHAWVIAAAFGNRRSHTDDPKPLCHLVPHRDSARSQGSAPRNLRMATASNPRRAEPTLLRCWTSPTCSRPPSTMTLVLEGSNDIIEYESDPLQQESYLKQRGRS